jgi:hypothetical protein
MNIFEGFESPVENWSKMPHALTDSLPEIKSLAEMKVIYYILRHTWGYQEYDTPKPITMDEFEHGRKRKDGTRIDSGVGMSHNAIKAGLDKASEHGFILISIDETDKARIEKSYQLKVKSCPPEGQELPPRGSRVDPRSSKS